MGKEKKSKEKNLPEFLTDQNENKNSLNNFFEKYKNFPKFLSLIGLLVGTIFGILVGFLLFFNWDYVYWRNEAKNANKNFKNEKEKNVNFLKEKKILEEKILSLETTIENFKNNPDSLNKLYKNETFKFQFTYKIDESFVENPAFEKEPFSILVKKESDETKNINIRVFGANSATARSLVLSYYSANECSSIPILQKEKIQIGEKVEEVDKGIVSYKNCGPEKLSFEEVFYIFKIGENKFMVNGISNKTSEMMIGILKTFKSL